MKQKTYDYFIVNKIIYFTIDLNCKGDFFYIQDNKLFKGKEMFNHTGIVTLFGNEKQIVFRFEGGHLKKI